MYQRIVCLLRELPVLVQITALDGNRILIPRRNRVCLLLKWNTLDQLTLVADNKVRACRPLLRLCQISKITAVLRSRSARIRGIVYKNTLDLFQLRSGSGKLIRLR